MRSKVAVPDVGSGCAPLHRHTEVDERPPKRGRRGGRPAGDRSRPPVAPLGVTFDGSIEGVVAALAQLGDRQVDRTDRRVQSGGNRWPLRLFTRSGPSRRS